MTPSDIFYQKLFNYGTLQLVASVEEDTARLQLQNGAYALPLVVDVNKKVAFAVFNNASIQTYDEMVRQLIELGAK